MSAAGKLPEQGSVPVGRGPLEDDGRGSSPPLCLPHVLPPLKQIFPTVPNFFLSQNVY